MTVAIIAAFPGELKHLVGLGFRPAPTVSKRAKKWTRQRGEEKWVAVCAGMGAEAARRAFAEAEAAGALDAVLSVGWAGALNAEVAATRTYIATSVTDAQTGERFKLSTSRQGLGLVSTAHVVREAEKRRLAATYHAAMVDMEAAAIVRLAQMRSIPVACVKAISDELGDQLPDLNPFVRDGQLHMLPFLAHVAGRPRTWRPLLHLGRNSAAAARNLASAIVTLLTGPNDFNDFKQMGLVQ